MGARQRINSLYFTGILIVAATIGIATQSWTAFLFIAGLLFGIFLHGGDVRLTPRRHKRGPRRKR